MPPFKTLCHLWYFLWPQWNKWQLNHSASWLPYQFTYFSGNQSKRYKIIIRPRCRFSLTRTTKPRHCYIPPGSTLPWFLLFTQICSFQNVLEYIQRLFLQVNCCCTGENKKSKSFTRFQMLLHYIAIHNVTILYNFHLFLVRSEGVDALLKFQCQNYTTRNISIHIACPALNMLYSGFCQRKFSRTFHITDSFDQGDKNKFQG